MGEKMIKDFSALTNSSEIVLNSSRVLLNNLQDSGVALKKNRASSAKKKVVYSWGMPTDFNALDGSYGL